MKALGLGLMKYSEHLQGNFSSRNIPWFFFSHHSFSFSFSLSLCFSLSPNISPLSLSLISFEGFEPGSLERNRSLGAETFTFLFNLKGIIYNFPTKHLRKLTNWIERKKKRRSKKIEREGETNQGVIHWNEEESDRLEIEEESEIDRVMCERERKKECEWYVFERKRV